MMEVAWKPTSEGPNALWLCVVELPMPMQKGPWQNVYEVDDLCTVKQKQMVWASERQMSSERVVAMAMAPESQLTERFEMRIVVRPSHKKPTPRTSVLWTTSVLYWRTSLLWVALQSGRNLRGPDCRVPRREMSSGAAAIERDRNHRAGRSGCSYTRSNVRP